MTHKETIEALVKIQDMLIPLEYDNGAVEALSQLIATLEASQAAAVAEVAAALSE